MQSDLGVSVQTGLDLFGHIPAVAVDAALQALLRRQRGLATTINPEKARSELLVAPVLTETWRLGAGPIALYPSVTFDVDPATDLTGVCDNTIYLDMIVGPRRPR